MGSRAPPLPICHPERSGPTFSSAPNYAASGCAVEGSLLITKGVRASALTFSHQKQTLPKIFLFPVISTGLDDSSLFAPSFRLPAVGGNGVRAVRDGFASHAFCAMNPPSPTWPFSALPLFSLGSTIPRSMRRRHAFCVRRFLEDAPEISPVQPARRRRERSRRVSAGCPMPPKRLLFPVISTGLDASFRWSLPWKLNLSGYSHGWTQSLSSTCQLPSR